MTVSLSKILLWAGTIITLSFGLVAMTSTPVFASNHPADAACEGLEITGGQCSANADSGIGSVVETIIDVLSLVVGAVSVIMIIVGGLKYVLSGGDSNAVSSAKNTILYAIVGLVIVIFAQAIVAFVINRVDPSEARLDSSVSQIA